MKSAIYFLIGLMGLSINAHSYQCTANLQDRGGNTISSHYGHDRYDYERACDDALNQCERNASRRRGQYCEIEERRRPRPKVEFVTCGSDISRVGYCNVGTGARVELDKNIFGDCIQGMSWGYDRDYIWVRNCGAVFKVTKYH